MSRTVARTAGLLAVAALTLTACSPVLTNRPYAASDGVRVVWSEQASVSGENLLLIAEASGEPARLIGALTNKGGDPVEVDLGFPDGDAATVEIPAGSTTLLEGEDTPEIVLEDVPEGPGSTVAMMFVTASEGAVTVEVPVLDGTLEEYASLVP